MNIEILDTVCFATFYQYNRDIPKGSIFNPERLKQDMFSIDEFEDVDILDSSLTRLQITLIGLIESEEILTKGFNKHFAYDLVEPKRKEAYKKVLLSKVFNRNYRSIRSFIRDMEFFYDYHILGMECK